MTTNCLCGAVSVTIRTQPDFIHDCNCSLCGKSGGAWGYFQSTMVTTTGGTVSFLRRDKENAAAELQSCRHCGTTTHWTFSPSFKEQHASVGLMGVNMRIFDPNDLEGVEVRFPDGDGWCGEGVFEYRREAMTISDDWRW